MKLSLTTSGFGEFAEKHEFNDKTVNNIINLLKFCFINLCLFQKDNFVEPELIINKFFII
jgi:hypothetical protein